MNEVEFCSSDVHKLKELNWERRTSKHQYPAEDERRGTKRTDGAAERHRGKAQTSGNDGWPEAKYPQHEGDTYLILKRSTLNCNWAPLRGKVTLWCDH